MKKIHDILKARIKHLHVTHSKKPLHTDFHPPIFEQPLLSKRDVKLSAIAAALSPKSIFKTKKNTGQMASQQGEKGSKPQSPVNPRGDKVSENKFHSQANLPSLRFFTPKRDTAHQPAKPEEVREEGEGEAGGDKLDKERTARLRALLNDVINHPGMMTPQMFWTLFMQIAPQLSTKMAGCVRVSALFWMMLSYIKAKNKNKKRKLKEQLKEASELLEKDNLPVMRVKRR